MRVLIVDDEESIRDALAAAFEAKGSSAVIAATAEDGLAKLAADGPFDAVLTDKNMPGKSGLDFLRELRAKEPGTAALMMTSFTSEDSARAALNLDVDGYLEKPFDDLIGVVDLTRTAVDRRKRRRGRPPGEQARVLLACAQGPERDALAKPLTGSTMVTAATESQLASMLRRNPTDVVVIDSRTFAPRVVDVVAAAMRLDPLPTWLVVHDGVLGIENLRKLIELGVKGIHGVADYPAAVRPLLERKPL